MLVSQLSCVPHCKYDPLLSFYKNAASIVVCAGQQRASFSQLLITQAHLYASTSFPPWERETVLIKLHRAYNCFECHLKAILTSWIAVEIPVVSDQSDPVLTRLRPRISWVCCMDQPSAQPSYLIPKSPKKQEGGCEWNGKKKKSEWIKYYIAAKVDNLGWNPFSSMADPMHAANTSKSTHFCELCWKETSTLKIRRKTCALNSL